MSFRSLLSCPKGRPRGQHPRDAFSGIFRPVRLKCGAADPMDLRGQQGRHGRLSTVLYCSWGSFDRGRVRMRIRLHTGPGMAQAAREVQHSTLLRRHRAGRPTTARWRGASSSRTTGTVSFGKTSGFISFVRWSIHE